MKKFNSIRKDFPILKSRINGKNLVYFDNAATTQKPKAVIDSILNYYQNQNANTHSEHFLASKLTEKIEMARESVAKFLNSKPESIVFTKGATESLNLVANSYGHHNLKAGDEIIVSQTEHHANFIPWINLAKENKIQVKIWEVEKDGTLDLKKLKNLINSKTKLLALVHVSNVLGIINPLQEILDLTKKNRIISVIDGTQAIPHLNVDLEKLDPDFYVFSSHKMYGPMGVGVLFINPKIVQRLKPYQTGGEMVEEFSLTETIYKKPPYLFEAGTLNFEGILGFNKAIDYLKTLKSENVFEYEKELSDYFFNSLSKVPGITILASNKDKIPLFSFYFKTINSYDLASFLNLDGIAIRVGKHCAHPLFEALNLNSTIRVSLCFYNTFDEIDFFIEKLKETIIKINQLSQ